MTTRVLMVNPELAMQVRAAHDIEKYDNAKHLPKEIEALQQKNPDAATVETPLGHCFLGSPRTHALKHYIRYVREHGKAAPFYDCTFPFRCSGGAAGIELLILNEPILSSGKLGSNEFYEANSVGQESLADSNFDEKRALSTINELNPDVLLIGTEFYAPVSDELLEEYMVKMHEKRKNTFELSPYERSYQSPISFPLNARCAIGFGQYSLAASGGVILANMLQKAGRPFSLFANHLPHGGESVSHAHTLDLLTTDDALQLVASNNHACIVENVMSPQEVALYDAQIKAQSKGDDATLKRILNEIRAIHARDGYKRVPWSDVPFSRSESGRIFIPRNANPFDNEGAPRLTEIIRIAEQHQKKT